MTTINSKYSAEFKMIKTHQHYLKEAKHSGTKMRELLNFYIRTMNPALCPRHNCSPYFTAQTTYHV